MISLGEGNWKVRFSTAWPSLLDCRWKAAGRPCRQKLTAWLSWCWTKLWAVADQGPPPGPGVTQARPGPGMSWNWVRVPPPPLSPMEFKLITVTRCVFVAEGGRGVWRVLSQDNIDGEQRC